MVSDLETLDFRNTFVQDLPAGFVWLTKLQNLLAGSQTKLPSGIGIMCNLRVISHFNVPMSSADALLELGNLANLNELNICLECRRSECGGPEEHKALEEKLCSSLHKLTGSYKLRCLQICCGDSHAIEFQECFPFIPSALQMFHMFSNYYFRKVPKWIAPSLASLASLDVNLTELTADDLHTLGELPALHCLILTLERGENRSTVEGIGFPSLKLFEIICDEGTYITFVKGAMPRLEYFKLVLSVSVGRNYGFYFGIVHLPCLKNVRMRFRSEGATISEIVAATAAIMEEVGAHSNHPRIDVIDGEEHKGKTGNNSKEDGGTEAN